MKDRDFKEAMVLSYVDSKEKEEWCRENFIHRRTIVYWASQLHIGLRAKRPDSKPRTRKQKFPIIKDSEKIAKVNQVNKDTKKWLNAIKGNEW